MITYIIMLTGLISAVAQYIDKYLVKIGITKKEYFYYMSVSMVPYSILMMILEYAMGVFKFNFGIIPIITIVLAMFLRYKKQHTVVGCLKHLNPYENASYLTLGVILAYIIDIIIGVQYISIIKLSSIVLIILGVFTVADSKIKLKELRSALFLNIITTLLIGYVTFYALQYISNASFLLIVNLGLVLLFSKDYNMKYHKEKKQIIKWTFIQQMFGFFVLYLTNYLSSLSVTLSSYVKPMSIFCIVLISIILGKGSNKPHKHQLLGITLIIIGTILINK